MTDIKMTEHKELAEEIAREGIVLLENDGTLPLKNVKRLALFGAGARHTVKGGLGSGYVHDPVCMNICDAFKEAGMIINSEAWLDRYDAMYKKAEDKYRADVRKAFRPPSKQSLAVALASDVSLPVMDVTQTNIESSPADAAIYVIARQSAEECDRTLSDYGITDMEQAAITRLSRAYNKFILVINSPGPIDMSFLNDISGVSAVIFMGQAGSLGGRALVDIITGKSCPSGRLTDTWVNKYADIPHGLRFPSLINSHKTVEYKEDTLVGYRFFDSQGLPVKYSFGHGLSYTEFKISGVSIKEKDGRITVKAKVKNTGDFSGKDTVQVFGCTSAEPGNGNPRTLLGFAKTDILEPGESEAIEMSFDVADMAWFSPGDECFCLPKADYYFFVGDGLSNANERLELHLDELKFVSRVNEPILPEAEDEVREEVERVMSHIFTEEMVHLSVGEGLFPVPKLPYITPGSAGHTSAALQYSGVINMEMADGPAGLRLQTRYGVYPDGTTKMFDPEFRAYEYVGPIVRKYLFADPKKSEIKEQRVTAFPVATVLAQTWNMDLIESFGRAVSEEMTDTNVTFWLGPALNIHRNPLGGRNFEYYSEDPLLCGKCAAACVRGVQSIPGHYAVIKHFCCNNQETGRRFSDSRLSESALRDIYLKGFEIAVREGRPRAVMTSYNLVNGEHTSVSKKLITDILRGEWKYNGIVMTDWFASDDADAAAIIKAGTDFIMPGTKADTERLKKAIEEGFLTVPEMEEHSRRILRAYFESNVPSLAEEIRKQKEAEEEKGKSAKRKGAFWLKK